MKAPYLGRALKGWTSQTPISVISKSIVNFQVVETPTTMTLDINYQPMPPAQVARKSEEQRTWKWWTLIVKGASTLLKTDDLVTIGTLTFRIQSARDWTTSGFSIYEAIEDFNSADPVGAP